MNRLPLTLQQARTQRPGTGVPSPCVSVCQMDPASGLCRGCWRTLDEIAGWGQLGDADKLLIWGRIEARQTAAS